MINAVIVDDEVHSRNVLNRLLKTHCPEIAVIAEAGNVDAAYNILMNMNPQLVFLDVKMPAKTGFDLLQMFDHHHFEVIFISAFNEYAVTAFEFNALGYVLKPINYHKLVLNVTKAVAKIQSNTRNTELSQFMKTLEPETQAIKKIIIHHNEKVVFLNIQDIVSLQVTNAICEIQLINNQHYYSTKDLKLFEDLLKKAGKFLRIAKNTILNLDHLKAYQKGEPCIVEMQNGSEFEVSRRKKTEILNLLNQD